MSSFLEECTKKCDKTRSVPCLRGHGEHIHGFLGWLKKKESLHFGLLWILYLNFMRYHKVCGPYGISKNRDTKSIGGQSEDSLSF